MTSKLANKYIVLFFVIAFISLLTVIKISNKYVRKYSENIAEIEIDKFIKTEKANAGYYINNKLFNNRESYQYFIKEISNNTYTIKLLDYSGADFNNYLFYYNIQFADGWSFTLLARTVGCKRKYHILNDCSNAKIYLESTRPF